MWGTTNNIKKAGCTPRNFLWGPQSLTIFSFGNYFIPATTTEQDGDKPEWHCLWGENLYIIVYCQYLRQRSFGLWRIHNPMEFCSCCRYGTWVFFFLKCFFFSGFFPLVRGKLGKRKKLNFSPISQNLHKISLVFWNLLHCFFHNGGVCVYTGTQTPPSQIFTGFFPHDERWCKVSWLLDTYQGCLMLHLFEISGWIKLVFLQGKAYGSC